MVIVPYLRVGKKIDVTLKLSRSFKMAELRSTLDVGRRLYNCPGERFDVFTILEVTGRFQSYAKTTAGLAHFFRSELPHQRVRWHDDGRSVLLQHGMVWVHVGYLDFLRMLFLPLYHCDWDAATLQIRDSIMQSDMNPTVLGFLRELIEPKTTVTTGVQLEDVPDDWRDLVESYIRKGAVDLANYSTIQELEHRVDQLEGLLDTNTSPTTDSQVALILPEEPPLPLEEREILAKTLRLDPQDFTTKRQAMELYSAANQ